MRRILAALPFVAAGAGLAACGAPDPCADVALGDSGIGLALTPVTHPGWGQAQCFACHAVARLHPGGCLPASAVDPVALRDADAGVCVDCHGGNGTEGTP